MLSGMLTPEGFINPIHCQGHPDTSDVWPTRPLMSHLCLTVNTLSLHTAFRLKSNGIHFLTKYLRIYIQGQRELLIASILGPHTFLPLNISMFHLYFLAFGLMFSILRSGFPAQQAGNGSFCINQILFGGLLSARLCMMACLHDCSSSSMRPLISGSLTFRCFYLPKSDIYFTSLLTYIFCQ